VVIIASAVGTHPPPARNGEGGPRAALASPVNRYLVAELVMPLPGAAEGALGGGFEAAPDAGF
jgi:hypothetical protein